MQPGRRRALPSGSSCSALRRRWRLRPAAQAGSGRGAWGRSGVCIAPLPFPRGSSCRTRSPSAIPCGRARPCPALSVRRAGCGGHEGSGGGCRPCPSLAPPLLGAGRRRPAVDGAGVPQPLRGWARRRRRRPPSRTRSRLQPARAGPAPGLRRQHDPWAARGLRSRPCRRQRRDEACATAAAPDRASRHPTRPARTDPGPRCPAPGAPRRRWRRHAAGVPRTPAAAQRRMVRHRQSRPEQAQHAAAERLGLAQGQVEHEAQGQHELGRQVGIQAAARRDCSASVPPSHPAPLRPATT